MERGVLVQHPVRTAVAAISVGVIKGEVMLDLCYTEDSHADVDFNVVMTGNHEFIEVQGTGEGDVFSRVTMDHLVNLAEEGISQLLEIEKLYI